MGKSLMICANAGATGFVDGTTHYVPIFGSLQAGNTTEADSEIAIRYAGTFRNLFTRVQTNSLSGNTVVTLRKSLAGTALTVTYTAGQTGVKEDTSNSVSFVDTDEADTEIAIDAEAGSINITFNLISYEFEADSSYITVCVLGEYGTLTLNDASTTIFGAPNGGMLGEANTTEADAKYRVEAFFRTSDFRTYVTTNSRTTDTVFKVRKNGADGNQSTTYTSGQTGAKEDTSNIDLFNAGDDCNFQVTTGTGTQNIVIKAMGMTWTSPNNQFPLLSARTLSVAIGPSVSRFIPVTGFSGVATSEAPSQMTPRFTFTAEKLVTYVSVNTNAVSSFQVHLRDAGANSALTTTYTAGQTGLKEDTSNSATITSATDAVGFRYINNDAAGSVTPIYAGVLGRTTNTNPVDLGTEINQAVHRAAYV